MNEDMKNYRIAKLKLIEYSILKSQLHHYKTMIRFSKCKFYKFNEERTKEFLFYVNRFGNYTMNDQSWKITVERDYFDKRLDRLENRHWLRIFYRMRREVIKRNLKKYNNVLTCEYCHKPVGDEGRLIEILREGDIINDYIIIHRDNKCLNKGAK